MRRESLIERRESAGMPVRVGDAMVTPLARSWLVRWSHGGAVWSRPLAILVEREGRTDRIPIVNLSQRIVWGLRLGAVALVATWMAHHRGRKNSNG